MHSVSNVMEIREDDQDEATITATATADAVATQYRKGQDADPSSSRLATGGIYTIDLVKDTSNGPWKIEIGRRSSSGWKEMPRLRQEKNFRGLEVLAPRGYRDVGLMPDSSGDTNGTIHWLP